MALRAVQPVSMSVNATNQMFPGSFEGAGLTNSLSYRARGLFQGALNHTQHNIHALVHSFISTIRYGSEEDEANYS